MNKNNIIEKYKKKLIKEGFEECKEILEKDEVTQGNLIFNKILKLFTNKQAKHLEIGIIARNANDKIVIIKITDRKQNKKDIIIR